MNIPILMYHQIDVPPPSGTPLRGLVVSTAAFARQMALLKILGYSGMSLSKLEPYLEGRKSGRVVGITFDDGYLNNLSNALPTLLQHGFSATCYAVSNQIGGTNKWDQGLVAPTPLMSEEHWHEWLRCGMEIGSHTMDHVDLAATESQSALAQIQMSKRDLEQRFGCEVRHFCYPYGRYTLEHVDMVKTAGYATATTTRRGLAIAGQDPFQLRRVLVAQATNPFVFCMKILSKYEDRRG